MMEKTTGENKVLPRMNLNLESETECWDLLQKTKRHEKYGSGPSFEDNRANIKWKNSKDIHDGLADTSFAGASFIVQHIIHNCGFCHHHKC